MVRTDSSNLTTRISISSCLLIVLLIGAAFNSLQAQSFDHEKYPKLDFDFISLELDLGIQPQNLRIDGAAKYELEANISGADTLTLYASHIDISSVSVGGESVNFTLHNDSLFVPVVDSSEVGERYEVNIRYSGRPQFGLLKNTDGTVWTSQLPKSQRHWVPIVDNPHVELKTTFNIAVPSGLDVWASGNKTGEEAVNVDVMRYQFTSQKELPASSLAFSVGEFAEESSGSGTPKINVITAQSLVDTVDSQQLLKNAHDYLADTEEYLQHEYPFEHLNVVVLQDHSWETKSWGGATVFLYQNRGDLQAQLLRGIIGQWFGVYQREDQWSQGDAITLYQTLVTNEITGDSLLLDSRDDLQNPFITVYDNFGPSQWNMWQTHLADWETETVRSIISQASRDILNNNSAVISWSDYAEYWYRQTGQPLFDPPEFSPQSEDSSSGEPTDSVAYKVTYDLNEAEGELKLVFEATQGSYSELTTLEAYEVYRNKTDTSEVTFTGAQDSVMLQIDPTISTLRLETSDYPTLMLDEYKPASFLIYELRNAETVSQRTSAARKLGFHRDNADLQLAIRDFMKDETAPDVQAALLSSLADITNGAAGTEQTFLNALQSENVQVRNAGLMALQHYQGNTSILNRVESLALNTDEMDFFKKTTQVATTLASEEQFAGFVESVTQRDSLGKKSIFAIQELANMGNTDAAVERAGLFTGESYPYNIRQQALDVLIQYDRKPADWLSRVQDLLNDSDPRIRFKTLEGLERNQNDEITSFLKEHMPDEYDARVYQKFEQLLQ